MKAMNDSPRRRVAVIGAGIAGHGAAWALSRDHDVTLYEKNDYFGGHSNTALIDLGGVPTPVDTGFIVYNQVNYPNLVKLFDHLGVATESSHMSFAVSLDDGRYEYSGNGAKGVFAQRRNWLNPRHWRMVVDLIRFYRSATHLVERFDLERTSLGALLDQLGLGDGFKHRHILPMAAAIWSAPAAQILAFPAASFIRFFDNHGLFKLSGRPIWRTVTGGSRCYVERLHADMTVERHLGRPVRAVERTPLGVLVHQSDGNARLFDDVVLATHGDDSLRLLSDASPREQAILGAFRYATNEAFLHRDRQLMPKRRALWSSWNYVAPRGFQAERAVPVTYWMNRLQNLDPAHDVFITLNPAREPAQALIDRSFSYRHPVFDQAAYDAQGQIAAIQGLGGVWYAGAYLGYGFHEDGLRAGLDVACKLGAKLPWAPALAAA